MEKEVERVSQSGWRTQRKPGFLNQHNQRTCELPETEAARTACMALHQMGHRAERRRGHTLLSLIQALSPVDKYLQMKT